MAHKLIEKETVKLGSIYQGSTTLICPRCGGEYLHQRTVRIFYREEDDEMTATTTVREGLSATHLRPSAEVGNPSVRRDGMAIAFFCEGCSDKYDERTHLELTVAQHKGVSMLGWRYFVEVPDESGVRPTTVVIQSKNRQNPLT